MKGFTLLYAILISSIVLTIGLGAFSLALGQIILAGNARDSAAAIYASDAGIECARYWDYNFDPFDASTRAFDNDGTLNFIFCFGDTTGKPVGGSSALESTSEFTYQLSNGAEVRVEVHRDELVNGSTLPYLDKKTVIYAYGRNNTVANPRTLERVFQWIHGIPY